MINISQTQAKLYLAIMDFFSINGVASAIEPFGSGHINDTFKVVTNQPFGPCYLLQRINTHVFKDVDKLMKNIDRICKHIKHKLESEAVSHPEMKVPTLIPTKNDTLYHRDELGQYWRVFILLEGTKSYDIVASDKQAREGGKAFGQFQRLLADLSPYEVYEVIPNFLHIGSRLKDFKDALQRNQADRAASVEEEIQFILDRENQMNSILDMAAKSQIPLRITHNDTKFNNVLLNEKDEAQCVVDLDTVMPGYVAYDFGDAIRTIINSAAEDESDLTKIKLNIPFFRAYTEGYLQEAHHFLYAMEINSLIDGVLLLPYMQTVRFLTDYLNGDTYYKISYPMHNLVRSRAQMKLVQEIEHHETLLRQIVRDEAAIYGM